MTLLIGTVSKNNIVLTADGLSRVNPITGAGLACEDLQKIFPHDTLPVAIVHHGLNIINRRQAGDRVADFFKLIDSEFGSSSLKQIAVRFIDFIDADAKATFNDPSNQGIIGFWIAGFGYHQKRPALFEICWPNSVKPNNLDALIIGGIAQDFLKAYLHRPLLSFSPNKRNLERYPSTFAVAYHNALYTEADRSQRASGENIFGGHKHQLVIKISGCSWTIRPK